MNEPWTQHLVDAYFANDIMAKVRSRQDGSYRIEKLEHGRPDYVGAGVGICTRTLVKEELQEQRYASADAAIARVCEVFDTTLKDADYGERDR